MLVVMLLCVFVVTGWAATVVEQFLGCALRRAPHLYVPLIVALASTFLAFYFS